MTRLELPLPATAVLLGRRAASVRGETGAAQSGAAPGTGPSGYAVPPLLTGLVATLLGPAASVGLLLGNGQRHEVTRSLLLGRSPVDPTGGGAALAAWPDLSRRLAKTHLLLEWTGTLLWVTDLHSGTGTSLIDPAGARRVLDPGVRAQAAIGTTIECGGRTVRVVPGA